MDASSLTAGTSAFNSAMLQAKAAQAQKATALSTAALGEKKLQDIDKAAKDFEGMFLAEMLSHMFSGIEVDPEFGGGHGEEMFRSMMVQEYGKQISNGPGLGIAAKVKEAMIAIQASVQHPD